MPANPERRNQILDAAIDILCDDGVGGLTHRQVDSRAGVPAGTTSNYFRTRQALLEATAARTVDLHWQRVEVLQSAVGPLTPRCVEGLDDSDARTRRAVSPLDPGAVRALHGEHPARRAAAADERAPGGGGEVGDTHLRGRRLHPDTGTDGRAQQGPQRLRVQQPDASHPSPARKMPPVWWTDCSARSWTNREPSPSGSRTRPG